MQVASDAVEVDFEEGTASLHVNRLSLFDFFNIPNALFRFQNPVSMPASVSFKLDWIEPVSHRASITNTTHGFKGLFLTNQARMAWSAHRSDGFRFASASAEHSTSVFSELGRVRNGALLEDDSGDD